MTSKEAIQCIDDIRNADNQIDQERYNKAKEVIHEDFKINKIIKKHIIISDRSVSLNIRNISEETYQRFKKWLER